MEFNSTTIVCPVCAASVWPAILQRAEAREIARGAPAPRKAAFFSQLYDLRSANRDCHEKYRLSFDKPLERGEKFRIGYRSAFGIANHRFAFGSKRRDGERHGHPMIAVRLDFSTVQAARGAACHAQAVGKLLDLRAHSAEVFRQYGDAIAFLHAQLGRVADLNSLLGIRTEH